MKPKDLSVLTKDEALLAQRILALEDDEETLYECITDLDPPILIKLAICHHEIDLICKRPIFDWFWLDIWKLCSDYHEVKPVVTIHCFDLVKAKYLYQRHENTHDQDEAHKYLEISADFGCFEALERVINRYVFEYKSSNGIGLHNIVTRCTQISKLYYTPGNIFAALSYCSLGFFSKNRFQNNAEAFFRKAMVCLHAAIQYYDTSSDIIHNLSLGKGIDALANRWTFDSWTILRDKLLGLIEKNLCPDMISDHIGNVENGSNGIVPLSK